MKFMVMVKATKDSEAGVMPSQELLTAMGNYNEELVNAGIMKAGEGLHPSSKGARVHFDGPKRTVVNGPFAETKELVAGYWMWECKSLDEAIAWVKKCPNPMCEPSDIEIRQVFSAADFGAEFTPELREQEAGVLAKGLGLGAIRFETIGERTVGGSNKSYTMETRNGIGDQWMQFAPQIGKVPGQVAGMVTYGVVWNHKDGGKFDYLCGVELKDASKLPKELTKVTVPGGRYAVFTHSGHISTFPETIDAVWSKWVPDAAVKIRQAGCFERYTEEFNPQTGLGGTELWIPIEG